MAQRITVGELKAELDTYDEDAELVFRTTDHEKNFVELDFDLYAGFDEGLSELRIDFDIPTSHELREK